MASCFVPLSVSGGSHVRVHEISTKMLPSFQKTPVLTVLMKSNRLGSNRNRRFSVSAEHRGGGSDFVAGFLIGGAVVGTLAYIFAPQIRKSLLNEDESGFRRAKRPIYYDEGLETTRQTLNEKISQLNSAIDSVSSRLRGENNNAPTAPEETDQEVEATT